jgi:hypothetical protein
MRFALEDFADTCRNVPLNPNSMKACEFVERGRWPDDSTMCHHYPLL